MFRMFLRQRWYSLPDEAVEDAIYDSYVMCKYMQLNFAEGSVLDATTLCKFTKIIIDNGIDKMVFEAFNRFMEENGYMMRGGMIMDATIIDTTKSTKNAEQARNP